MATDGPVMRWNQLDYSASDERLMFSSLLMPSGGAFSARAGLRPGGGQVTVSGTTVTVQPVAGVIYDPAYASAGPYLWALPALKQVSLGNRPGTGQSRIVPVIARIYDPDIGLGSARELKIEAVTTGNASPTPTAPALPPLSIEIARATVPASGTVTLTVGTARTVAAGGVLPVPTEDARDQLPSPYRGLHVYVEGTDRLYRWNGTAWVLASAPPSTDQPWTDLTVVSGSGWTRNTGTGRPRICRRGDQVIYTGGVYGGSAGSTAFTLPQWARPSSDQGTLAPQLAAAGSTTGATRLRVWPNGALQPQGNIHAEAVTSWPVA